MWLAFFFLNSCSIKGLLWAHNVLLLGLCTRCSFCRNHSLSHPTHLLPHFLTAHMWLPLRRLPSPSPPPPPFHGTLLQSARARPLWASMSGLYLPHSGPDHCAGTWKTLHKYVQTTKHCVRWMGYRDDQPDPQFTIRMMQTGYEEGCSEHQGPEGGSAEGRSHSWRKDWLSQPGSKTGDREQRTHLGHAKSSKLRKSWLEKRKRTQDRRKTKEQEKHSGPEERQAVRKVQRFSGPGTHTSESTGGLMNLPTVVAHPLHVIQ